MSVAKVQELISLGELDMAQSYLFEFSTELIYEKNLYLSLVLLNKGDYQEAVDYAVEAYDIVKFSQYDNKHVYAHIAIAYGLLKLGKLNESKFYIKNIENKLLDSSISDELDRNYWLQYLYLVKGGIQARCGEAKESIESFEKCLDLSLMLNNKRLLSGIYNNLGYGNNLIGKSKIAFDYYCKSLEIAEELNNDYQI